MCVCLKCWKQSSHDIVHSLTSCSDKTIWIPVVRSLLLGYEPRDWYKTVSKSKPSRSHFPHNSLELIWISYSLSNWRFSCSWNDHTVLRLWYDTLWKHKQSRLSEVSSLHEYDKWRKVVVLLREYKNVSNMSFKIYTTNLSNIDGMK